MTGRTLAGTGRLGARLVTPWLGLVGLLLTAECTGGTAPESPPATTAPASEPTMHAVPPDGGEVKLVETGMSVWYDDEQSTHIVSYGVTVENTSQAVAHATSISIWLVDADGNRMTNPAGAAEPWLTRSISRVMPGQQLALGDMHALRDEHRPAELRVEIEAPEGWERFDNSYWLHRSVTAGSVTTERSGHITVLSFLVDAPYTPDMLPRGAAGTRPEFVAIFRDRDGAIVGGYECCGSIFMPPGQSQQQLTLDGTPPETEDSRTEIYLLG
jgi:hypothetical protein